MIGSVGKVVEVEVDERLDDVAVKDLLGDHGPAQNGKSNGAVAEMC